MKSLFSRRIGGILVVVVLALLLVWGGLTFSSRNRESSHESPQPVENVPTSPVTKTPTQHAPVEVKDMTETVFEENFDDGVDTRWVVVGDWQIVSEGDNAFWRTQPVEPDLESQILAAATYPLQRLDYDDMTLQLDLRFDLPTGGALIGFRSSFGDSAMLHGYFFKIQLDGVTLYRYDGVDITELTSAEADIPLDGWHQVVIEGVGNHLALSVDDVSLLTFDDPDALYTGGITLSAYADLLAQETALVDYDNIRLSARVSDSAGWQQIGPDGGIIYVIEADPHHPGTLYAAGRGGGVYKSTDGGETWNMLPQIVPASQEIRDLHVSPTDDGVVYAVSNGLYKSTDGGETWRMPVHDCCGEVTVSPTDGNFLLANGPGTAIWLSRDGGETWEDVTGSGWALDDDERISTLAIAGDREFWVGTGNYRDGSLYHTTDGGATWQRVDTGKRAETDICSLYVNPDNPKEVFVGVMDVWNVGFDVENDAYLLHTTDGGATWEPLQLPGVSPNVNVIGIMSDGRLYAATGETVFVSEDDGEHWTELAHPEGTNDLWDLAVSPEDPQTIYLPYLLGVLETKDGGETWSVQNRGISHMTINILETSDAEGGTLFASGDGVYRTTDNGQTWTRVRDYGSDELVPNPHSPGTWWQVIDRGDTYATNDNGDTWHLIYRTMDPYKTGEGGGFRFGSAYALATAPSDADILYATKNGFGIYRTDDRGVTWHFLLHSEVDYTYSMAVHPQDPNIIFSGYSSKPFQDWAMVRVSRDGGESWDTALKIPGADSVTSVAIDYEDPNLVYAGSTGARGGVWASEDGGYTWTEPAPGFTFTNVHVFAVSPSEPERAYAATWGGGTYVTQDGGETWSLLESAPTESASALMLESGSPETIYLADRTAPRIYRSQDGGETWETYFDAGEGHYRVMTAALARSSSGVLYASVFSFGGPMAGDVFRIENGEGQLVTNGLPRLPVDLMVDPADANTVYAVLHQYGVYKTTDGGAHWEELPAPGSGKDGAPQFGFNHLVIAPDDPQTLYLLGGCDINIHFQHNNVDPEIMNAIYRSQDGGETWEKLSESGLGAVSGSIKGLAIDPSNPNILYAGAAGGVFRSTDGGVHWQPLGDDAGLQSTGIALNQDGSLLYRPTAGGGVLVGTVSNAGDDVLWQGESTLVMPVAHVEVEPAPQGTSTALYASAYPGGVFKSTDGGHTWIERNFGLASFHIDDPSRQGYYAFAIANSDARVLYLGSYGVGVYRSDDGGDTWRPVNGAAGTMRHQPITALLIDPEDAENVFVGTENGVFHSTDGGQTWEEANQGLEYGRQVRSLALSADRTLYVGLMGYEVYTSPMDSIYWEGVNAFGNWGHIWPIWNDRPNYQYTALLFHPEDPDTIIFGTFPSGIFISHDGGVTWKESNVGWPNDGVFSLVTHPENSDIIYSGTYNGVNRSLDGGAHWERWDTGWPGEQWVYSIDFDPRNPDIMYACSKNGENEGVGRDGFHGTVMKSTDGGAHWFPITTGLNLNQEFYKIIVDPFSPDTLYLATQYEGVFVSRDDGETWHTWNRGLTNPVAGSNGNNVTNCLMMSADGRWLYFGSSGSGVYRREVPRP